MKLHLILYISIKDFKHRQQKQLIQNIKNKKVKTIQIYPLIYLNQNNPENKWIFIRIESGMINYISNKYDNNKNIFIRKRYKKMFNKI